METIVGVVIFTITAVFLVVSLFERQIKKALKKRKQNKSQSS